MSTRESASALEPRPTLALVGDDHLAVVTHHHRLVEQAVGSIISHAIQAGEGLLKIKALIPAGDWTQWLHSTLPFSAETAFVYMRVARNRERVEKAEPQSLSAAVALLRQGGRTEPPAAIVSQAKSLRSQGRTYSEIAEQMGVSSAAVWTWCNPGGVKARKAKARSETLAGRKVLGTQQEAADVRAKGGPVAESYSLIRKALQVLDGGRSSYSDREVTAAIDDAMQTLYRAEDALVKASRLT